jgi:hypothetical protein
MALSPKETKKTGEIPDDSKRKVPWVAWIAILLGVTMAGIGLLLLLWGLAWQTDVGEPQNIDGDDFQGGPCLIPLGGAMLLVGFMWILTGWRGFKKVRANEDMQICRNCGKMIESDLNFCYYCNKTFDEMDDSVQEEVRRPRKEKHPKEEEKVDREIPKKARPFSPEER